MAAARIANALLRSAKIRDAFAEVLAANEVTDSQERNTYIAELETDNRRLKTDNDSLQEKLDSTASVLQQRDDRIVELEEEVARLSNLVNADARNASFVAAEPDKAREDVAEVAIAEEKIDEPK